MSSDTLVFLYTALTRASYRRGLFDALSYPPEHVVSYCYRKRNIRPSLPELEGRQGLIIYVDLSEANEVTYFPTRFVTIQQPRIPEGSISQALERERIYLPLRLGRFVEYKPGGDKGQWHEVVKGFDSLREIAGSKPGTPKYFVIGGRNQFTALAGSERTAWEDLVSKLSESSGLRAGRFLRIDDIKFASRESKAVGRIPKGERLAYDLRPAQIYRLDFSVYERSDEKTETKITVTTSSSELLTIDQPFQSVVSGLVEKSALIACKRTTEKALATISLAVSESTESQPGKVNSPSPVLFVQISYSKWVILLFLAAIIVGTFLVSLDFETVREYLPCKPHAWTTAFKLVGAGFLACAAWLVFRRLPSGRS